MKRIWKYVENEPEILIHLNECRQKEKKINQKTVFPEEGTLCYKDNKSWYS